MPPPKPDDERLRTVALRAAVTCSSLVADNDIAMGATAAAVHDKDIAMAATAAAVADKDMVEPETVPLRKLCDLIFEIQRDWGPVEGPSGSCVLLQRPRNYIGLHFWDQLIIDKVQSDLTLSDGQRVYAMDALKRYYGV
jgi:hypothetical protein